MTTTTTCSTFFLGWTRSSTRNKTFLPQDFEPSDMDVLCGRGKEYFNHTGNRRFRVMIDLSLPQYLQAETKTEKTSIVSAIVDKVRWSRSSCATTAATTSVMPTPIDENDTDRCALFVRFDRKKELWYDIGDEAAREKVGQTVREMLIQRDPAKRERKRRQRAALCTSKRGMSVVQQATANVFRDKTTVEKLQQQLAAAKSKTTTLQNLLMMHHNQLPQNPQQQPQQPPQQPPISARQFTTTSTNQNTSWLSLNSAVPSPQLVSSQPSLPMRLPTSSLSNSGTKDDTLVDSVFPSAIMLADPTTVSGPLPTLELRSGGYTNVPCRREQDSPIDTISYDRTSHQYSLLVDDDDDANTISTDLFSVESQDSNVFDLMFEIPNTIYVPGETSKCPAA